MGRQSHRVRFQKVSLIRIIYLLIGVYCLQHLVRDYQQDHHVQDWYTTFGHSWLRSVPDTRLNNDIGMFAFFFLGCLFLFLAFRKTKLGKQAGI
jgi:hypothetical protein